MKIRKRENEADDEEFWDPDWVQLRVIVLMLITTALIVFWMPALFEKPTCTIPGCTCTCTCEGE